MTPEEQQRLQELRRIDQLRSQGVGQAPVAEVPLVEGEVLPFMDSNYVRPEGQVDTLAPATPGWRGLFDALSDPLHAEKYLGADSNPYNYAGAKSTFLPMTKAAIDLGASAALPGVVAPVLASSGLGAVPEIALRFGGKASDDIFHRSDAEKVEPGQTYRSIVDEALGNAGSSATAGLLIGGGTTLLGKGVGVLGNVAHKLWNKAGSIRESIFPPSALQGDAAIAAADEQARLLMDNGVFPPSSSQNPFGAAYDRLVALKQSMGDELAALRGEVDTHPALQLPPSPNTPWVTARPNQASILDPQNPEAMERYLTYNRYGSQTGDQANKFNNQLGKEVIDNSMNVSQVAGKKAAYADAQTNFPADTFSENLMSTFRKRMQQTEDSLMKQFATPEKYQQYLAAKELYQAAEAALPQVGAYSGRLAQSTPAKPAGFSLSDKRAAAFASGGDLLLSPSGRRTYRNAFTPQGAAGRFAGGPMAEGLSYMGDALSSAAGAAGSLIPDVVGSSNINSMAQLGAQGAWNMVPEMSKAGAQELDSGPLLSNLTEPKAVAISRNLNQIDAAAIDALIPSFVEDYNAQPLQFQFKRLVAEGDKSKIADFLGQLANKYPDFPMQRGAVTGLPSEFDLGDGVARLISPMDKSEYERRVNVSELNVMEKAMRIKAIREQGIAHRFDMPLINDPGPMTSKQPSSGGYQFAPRQQTASGSRKVE